MNDFKCKGCGECCSNLLPLTVDEIIDLKFLAKGKESHKRKYLNDYYMVCPFLNENNRCDIYENRPWICKTFTCDKFKNAIFDEEDRQEIDKKRSIVNLRKEIFNEEM
jgi:Fe-S-cluster containining protein